MPDINSYAPRSGRMIRENGTVVNEADGIQSDGSRFVSQIGSNVQIADATAAWANSAAAGTAVNLDVVLPTKLQSDALYEVTVTNPSAESDLTVVIKNKETFGGTARYPELTRFGVLKNNPDGKSVVVQGWLLGEAGRLSLSNDTALGLSGSFTAYVRARKV
jgi:hypothetical protein